MNRFHRCSFVCNLRRREFVNDQVMGEIEKPLSVDGIVESQKLRWQRQKVELKAR
jgi:hypothetical protein